MDSVMIQKNAKELREFLDIDVMAAILLADSGESVDSLKQKFGNLPGMWIKELM